jgi:hypothetical protein
MMKRSLNQFPSISVLSANVLHVSWSIVMHMCPSKALDVVNNESIFTIDLFSIMYFHMD